MEDFWFLAVHKLGHGLRMLIPSDCLSQRTSIPHVAGHLSLFIPIRLHLVVKYENYKILKEVSIRMIVHGDFFQVKSNRDLRHKLLLGGNW